MEASFLPDERGSGPRHFQLSKADMRSEEKRLRTFQQWPESSPVSATDLAKAGFFFLGPDDRVQCFCCGGILWSWEAEDEPMREHGKFFPTCKFICGEVIGNQRMIPFKKILDYVDGQILSLLQRMDVEDTALPSQPEYPEMETEAVRLTTFENWPPYTDLYPEHLARAGFFYTGQGDTVRCFYCDGSLRNWELGDDPWREHAKWFPRCEFLLRSRGREFVSRVQDAYYNSPGASWQQAEQNPPTPQESTPRQPDVPGPRQEAQAESSKESELPQSTEEQLRRLQEERMCKVCMDKDVSIVFVPCGHLVVCAECAPSLRRCPICRAVIRGSVRTFMS
ncbi:baculoviral IAP repeat-containing protein 7 isoform X4 [Pelodiscus sinensis]|uniref:baculoviral IAP repeat-containing protein 7 isoform X4 n=1 Tax=Pelodiscus sinensis TaxID=13735 RepID=UPI003F6D4846